MGKWIWETSLAMSGKKEILFTLTKKDFEIQWYSGHGKGGQNRNKHQNCCRIRHPESGAVATGQEQRDRSQNQKAAFHRLAESVKFKLWLNQKINDVLDGETIEQKVEKTMRPENLRCEMSKDGKWVPWNEEEAN